MENTESIVKSPKGKESMTDRILKNVKEHKESFVPESIPEKITFTPKTLEDAREIIYPKASDLNPVTKRDNRIEAEEIMVNYLKYKFRIKNIEDDNKREMWVYDGGVYVPNGVCKLKTEIRKILGIIYTDNKAKNVIDKITTETYITNDEFFKSDYPYYIPVKNGILDVRTSNLLPFNPKYVFRNKLEWNYNKDAKCPNIIKHFKEVFENESDIDVFQETLGNCLLKEMRFEKAVMMTGKGRNGKSVTLKIIKKLLGKENCSSLTLQKVSQSENNYELSELMDKYVNLGGDISAKPLENTEFFKMLTGGDAITAQRKFLNPITLQNYAKMFFSCNTLPKTKDNTDAFFSRWIIFNFPYKFVPKEELHLRDNFKLRIDNIKKELFKKSEMEGLLVFALEGLNRLIKNKSYSKSKSTDNMRELYTNKSDPLKRYITENIECNPNGFIYLEEFRSEISRFIRNGDIDVSVSDKEINYILTSQYGVTRKQNKVKTDKKDDDGKPVYIRKYIWSGISFKKSREVIL